MYQDGNPEKLNGGWESPSEVEAQEAENKQREIQHTIDKEQHEVKKRELRERTAHTAHRIFAEHNDQAQQNMRLEALQDHENSELTPDDMTAVEEAMPFLISDKPEFQKYLQKLLPRLNNIIEKVGNLNAAGKKFEATIELGKFLTEENVKIEEIKDDEIREKLQRIMALELEITPTKANEIAESSMSASKWKLFEATGVGPVVRLIEASKKKTMHGDELSTSESALMATKAIATIGFDVGLAFATAGIGNAGLIGFETITTIKEGYEIKEHIGEIRKLAGLLSETKANDRASQAFLKVSDLLEKSPATRAAVIAELNAYAATNRKIAKALKKRDRTSIISRGNDADQIPPQALAA